MPIIMPAQWNASLPPQGSPAAKEAPPPPPVAVHVALPAGSSQCIVAASLKRIDEAHANPLAKFLEMRTKFPSPSQMSELKAASMVTEEKLQVATGGKRVELMMPPNAAYTALLKLERLAGKPESGPLHIS